MRGLAASALFLDNNETEVSLLNYDKKDLENKGFFLTRIDTVFVRRCPS
jgi:hypothetical protein